MWRALFFVGLIGCGNTTPAPDMPVVMMDLAGDMADPTCISVPRADPTAPACCLQPQTEFPPAIICFGSDPAPYEQYLRRGDAGVRVGQCPSIVDFVPVTGDCTRYACGPLLPSAAREVVDGGDSDCCFALEWACLA
jgi:hypothetical protein